VTATCGQNPSDTIGTVKVKRIDVPFEDGVRRCQDSIVNREVVTREAVDQVLHNIMF
jgi:hypothetical protein